MTPRFRPPDTAVDSVQRFDNAVDRAFDHLRGKPLPDKIFYGVSELGNFSLIWHLVGSVDALRRTEPVLDLARFSSLIILEAGLVNGPIKSMFKRGRPVHDAVRPHHLRKPRTSSFPSGHASAAFLAAALLSDGSKLDPVYYGLAAVVASSRSYVRIHHASDVVGGAVLGIALGAIARKVWPRGTWPPGR